MKNIRLSNSNFGFHLNKINSNFNNNNNLIILPYDNIDEFLKEIFNDFKIKIGNKYVLQNNIFQIKDEEYLHQAKDDIRKLNTSYSPFSSNRKNHFLTQSLSVRNYNKKKIKLSPEQKDTVNTLLSINNLIIKLENEAKNLKREHLFYFRKKYESMKLKGTSECIKYDLMFCALFGNFAVY